MKRIIYFLLLLCIGKTVSAQTANAILFTENGEKFTVILNGLRQNETPETNVKVTGLNAEWYKLKVIFADTKLGEQDFNMGIELGSEVTYSVKKNSKGKYVLRPISAVPLAQAPPTTSTQSVVVYNPTPAPAEEYSSGTQTVTQQTTTTSHSSGSSDNVNISMGVNMNENGGGININMSGMDPNMDGHAHTTTTTTTTTVHSSSSSSTPPPPAPVPVSYLPGYNGPIGCPVPMSPAEFGDFKSSVDSKTFEDTKMTVAKQVAGNNCLLSSQVKQLLSSFDFEATKLEFAKFAYHHTYDIGNYYKVNDAFEFESSMSDLTKYVNAQR